MAVYSENELNLKTLQRVDSNIIEIIDNTSHVAIYKYDLKLNQWDEANVEGTLFLFRRSAPPYHAFIVVNRMNTTNFVESITSDMKFELQEPYLLYMNTSGDIICCWFYEHKDMKRISKKMQTIVLKQTSSPKRQRCASESEKKEDASGGQDIMTLLSQAPQKYKNQEEQKNASIHHKLDDHDQTKCSPLKSGCLKDQPLSPRRRFMSTGSFDSQQKAAIYWLTESKENHNVNNPPKLSQSQTITHMLLGEKPANANRLFGNRDMPLSRMNVAEERNGFETNASFLHNQKSLLNQMNLPYQDWKHSENKDAHFTSIKQVLKSQVQDNPQVVQQIHEAYLSSLRSVFTKH